VTEEKEEKENELILQDRRITTRELIAAMGIGFNALGTFLRKLGYRKLCARWVPRILTQDDKEQRLQACTNLLERYESLGDDFLGSIVT
jgi:histone-lysine N-methyltransferase SETMAR